MSGDKDQKPRRAREILLTDVRVNFATLVVLGGILVSIISFGATITMQIAVLRTELNAHRQLVQSQLDDLESRIARVE